LKYKRVLPKRKKLELVVLAIGIAVFGISSFFRPSFQQHFLLNVILLILVYLGIVIEILFFPHSWKKYGASSWKEWDEKQK